jgi:hypothetical protein
MTTIKVDASRLNKRVGQLGRVMDANAQKMARWGMQRAVTMILRISPPASQKQGRDSITRNLQKGFPLLAAKSFADKRIGKAVMRALKMDDEKVLAALMPRSMRDKRLVPFNAALYRGNVDKYGRARKGNFITTDAQRWTAYQKKLQANVGKLRGGWNATAQLVGVAQRDIKAFAAKHGTSGGKVVEFVKKSSAKVVGINQSNYLPPDRFQTQIKTALELAEKNMTKIMRRVQAGMRAGKDPKTLFSADVFND